MITVSQTVKMSFTNMEYSMRTAQALALFQLRINNTTTVYNYDVACKASAFLIDSYSMLKLRLFVLTVHLFRAV